MFTHDNNGDKKKERRKCDGVYGFDVFMSFSFIWDECVVVDIVGHWLIVWQRSYQAKSNQQKSYCGMEERRITKQISGKRGGFFFLVGKGF